MTFVPLSRRPGGVQSFKMLIPATPSPLEPALKTHDGFEWLFVLNGRVRLVLDDLDLTLPPGEAAEFDTSKPHWLGSADGGAVELLILFDPQGCARTSTPTGSPPVEPVATDHLSATEPASRSPAATSNACGTSRPVTTSTSAIRCSGQVFRRRVVVGLIGRLPAWG